MNTSPMLLIVGGVGALLVYSSVKGLNPLDLIRSVVGGDKPEQQFGATPNDGTASVGDKATARISQAQNANP